MNDTTMAANQDFQYDVFLSHSAQDKAAARPLAERLRQDGLQNGSQPSTTNYQPHGGSDWAYLEAGTCGRGNLPFRDPLNQERRFIHPRHQRPRPSSGHFQTSAVTRPRNDLPGPAIPPNLQP